MCFHQAYDLNPCYVCQKPCVDRAGFEKCPNEGRCEVTESKNEEKSDKVEQENESNTNPTAEEETEGSNQAEQRTLTADDFALWEQDAYLFFGMPLTTIRCTIVSVSSMPTS